MSLISSAIPNFVNGVSQQPYTLRLSSQGALQQNGLSTVADGLRKRPPTEHLAKIGVAPVTSAMVHLVNRDLDEQYVVIITSGALKVYDLSGVEQTVVLTNAGYLTTALPVSESFALTTVADYTFISNKTMPVAASATLAASRPHEALINVRLGNYGKDYRVLVNGTLAATYTTPNGATSADVPTLSTEHIATQLLTGLVASGHNTAPWEATRHGSTLYLRNNSADFTVTVEDGFNNNAMVSIKRRLQKFTDLPANPRVDGFMVEIVGDQASEFDNYWVKFDGQGGSDSSGVWREAGAPDISVGLNPLTMPHQLIRLGDGSFTFGPAAWTQRKAGNAETNPHPSFVGRPVNDVFFFKNRLGFLSDENFIMSEAGKFFNWYRTTLTTLLDSDPVDATAATNKVAILEHAVPFNKQLLLFSAQQQFVVDSAQVMTPKKVPIEPTGDFAASMRAKPVASGKNVYFAADKGRWSAVRELFVEPSGLTHDAADVTAHVPAYIPSGVVQIAASPGEDTLVLLSENDRSRLYVYRYYYSGNEKLQSSWSHFSFASGGTILHCALVGPVLYVIISRADGLYFEKLDLSLGAQVDGEPYQVLLDRKVVVATGALSLDGAFTVINPAAVGYAPTVVGADLPFSVVCHGGGDIKAGQLATVLFDGVTIKVRGDYTATAMSFGQGYLFQYGLSTLTRRIPSQGGGQIADTGGRTQVRGVTFNHASTGYYRVTVAPESRSPFTYIFAGKVLGSPSAGLGTISLPTGTHRAAVMSRNTTVDISVESDMPMPVAILSATWEAFYTKRSRDV